MVNQSEIITYINEHLKDGNDEIILHLLNEYIHSSHCYSKQNMDGSWLTIQPSFPEEKVNKYLVYYDKEMECHHRANRIVLYFEKTLYEIGLFKFKAFARQYRLSSLREKLDFSKSCNQYCEELVKEFPNNREVIIASLKSFMYGYKKCYENGMIKEKE